jgi:monothiol glutaredoxin
MRRRTFGLFRLFFRRRRERRRAGLYFALQEEVRVDYADRAPCVSLQVEPEPKPKPKGLAMTEKTSDRIQSIIDGNDVVLFMKGVPAAPQCGFSAAVVQILGEQGVPYGAVNVLADPFVREGIKAFSNWPTIPQLYVKGEFIGGCDIVREMAASGELTQLFADKGVAKVSA